MDSAMGVWRGRLTTPAQNSGQVKFRRVEEVWRKVRRRYSAVVKEGIPGVINGRRQVRTANPQKASL